MPVPKPILDRTQILFATILFVCFDNYNTYCSQFVTHLHFFIDRNLGSSHPVYPQCRGRASLVLPTAKWAWLVGVAKPLPPAHSSIRYLCAPYAKYSLRQTSMQTVGRSPDISVMWLTEYYAGAGYIRHVAVKRLKISIIIPIKIWSE